jgi:carbon-monoxide dehydrogenase large subunit
MVARELGMDPLEVRLRNAVEEGSESVLGEVLHSVGVKECLRKAADALDWTAPRVPGRGRGIACMHKSTGTPTSSAAFVKLNEDGTVTMLSSSVEMGQGATTVLAQIVAEELGVKPEHIRVVAPDTDVTPYDRSTTSSRTTFHAGNALRAAARDARQQMLEVAADLLEAAAGDLELRDERVWVKGSPDHFVPFSKLWKSGMYARGQYPILGRGAYSTSAIYDPLDPVTGRSKRATAFWMYAAQAAEVEVDLETGKVTVLRLTAAHDMGRAINPQTCRQQIEGALVMGLGQALFEQLVIDQGRPLNPSFIDYKIPCTLDIPQLEAILVEAEHDEGPFGAKGLGEPGLAPTAAAIANAIFDAIGVRMRDLPITAERVMRALRERMEAAR